MPLLPLTLSWISSTTKMGTATLVLQNSSNNNSQPRSVTPI